MIVSPSLRVVCSCATRFVWWPCAFALFAISLWARPLRAQIRVQPERADTTGTRADSTPAPPDTTRVNGITPKGAFFRSLIIPGWGQSAIGSPTRGGVYFALEAGSLWMVYKANRKVADARRREEILRAGGELDPTKQTGLLHSRLSQREDWITLSLFWLFASGADAFVATHLADFNTHVGTSPGPDGGTEVRASVPLGRP